MSFSLPTLPKLTDPLPPPPGFVQLLPAITQPQFPDMTQNYLDTVVKPAQVALAKAQADAEAQAEALAETASRQAQAVFASLPASSLLARIQICESGGNPLASNGTHFGLYQFDLSTWASVGGSGNPLNASANEQTYRATLLFNARGTSPWLASIGCWQ